MRMSTATDYAASQSGAAVLIMARAPQAGTVKTRLEPLLGPQRCARLQSALLRSAITVAIGFAPARTYVALDTPVPLAYDVQILTQRGTSLGTRMQNAVDDVFGRDPGPVVVIGTDIPALRRSHLRDAVTRLMREADVVFGPALDGGYYLVALRRPTPSVFTIDPDLWGGDRVLATSLDHVQSAGLRSGLLETLRDLDTPADAAAFLAEGTVSDELAGLLRAPDVIS